jgi:hypothetical protein
MNAPWYGTDKLQSYNQPLQDIAMDLFRRVEALIGARARIEEGSFSFERSEPSTTVEVAAKLVIYQVAVGRGDHWRPVLTAFMCCFGREATPLRSRSRSR